MYRTIAKTPGFDADLENTSLGYGWLESCANMECLDLILKYQIWNFAYLSIETKFELALQITRSSINCLDILRFIGLRPSDHRLASLRNSSGMSLLHYIARRITGAPSSVLKDWLDLGVNILKGSADLFSIAQRQSRDHIGPFGGFHWSDTSQEDQGTTPFMELIGLRLWGIDMDCQLQRLLKNIRNWVTMMQQAGIDLRDYGTKESQMWRSLGSEDHAVFERRKSNNTCPPAKIEQLVFGPTPTDWSLIYRRYPRVPVFKQYRTPGTCPSQFDLPETIIWCPTEQEEMNGPWETQPRIEIASAQMDLRDMCVRGEDSFTQLVDSTQDDSGTIMLMQYRISRPRTSNSRSHSQPPSIQRTRTDFSEQSKHHSWMGRYHLCPFDSRRRPGCATLTWEQYQIMLGFGLFDLRSCVKGISAGRSFSFQESEEWRNRSYLAEIAACQDKLDRFDHRWSRNWIDHTQDCNCPWGCNKISLSQLRVPDSLQDFHPRRIYEEQ